MAVLSHVDDTKQKKMGEGWPILSPLSFVSPSSLMCSRDSEGLFPFYPSPAAGHFKQFLVVFFVSFVVLHFHMGCFACPFEMAKPWGREGGGVSMHGDLTPQHYCIPHGLSACMWRSQPPTEMKRDLKNTFMMKY